MRQSKIKITCALKMKEVGFSKTLPFNSEDHNNFSKKRQAASSFQMLVLFYQRRHVINQKSNICISYTQRNPKILTVAHFFDSFQYES